MNHVERIQHLADELIADAARCGVVVTIETVSKHPPAMGNVRMVSHSRPARTPANPFNLDLACTMAMVRIRQDIDSAYENARLDLAINGAFANHAMEQRHKGSVSREFSVAGGGAGRLTIRGGCDGYFFVSGGGGGYMPRYSPTANEGSEA